MTTSKNTPAGAEGVTGALVLPPDALVSAAAGRLVEEARANGVALTGDGGLLTGLVREVLQTALEAEITDHLGYEPHALLLCQAAAASKSAGAVWAGWASASKAR